MVFAKVRYIQFKVLKSTVKACLEFSDKQLDPMFLSPVSRAQAEQCVAPRPMTTAVRKSRAVKGEEERENIV